MSLMKSISGIRGIVGESLTPDVVVKYAGAFAEYCNRGRIVIGRDGRITGKIIGNIVSSTLFAAGCDVVAIGIAPTPTIALAVEQLGAAGGISITASHNPMQWNGLKFIGSSGMFLDADENRRFWTIGDLQRVQYASWDKLGKHVTDESFIKKHIDAVLALPYIEPEEIQRRKFKVVVDCINAAGGVIVPALLRELGCRVIEINCDVSGVFTRTPEPIPENLGTLCKRVCDEKADLGIAVDPDVDRLVLINEKGKPFGEEYTIASVVSFILGETANPKPTSHIPHRTSNSVVVNLSTTRAIDDVATKYNVQVFRTPVGEINVAKKMKEVGAIVGGEGSGGVILPVVHYARDAMVGIGLVLQQLAEFDGTLSEFKATLPQYSITKSRVNIVDKDPDVVLDSLKQRYGSSGRVNTDDGLKIDFADSWVHLRKSNTEPIVRIIAEAPTMEKAKELVRKFKEEIQ